jgi:hypothetical protein
MDALPPKVAGAARKVYLREDKQSLNDRRKWKLAEINGVRCLTMMNGIMERLSNRKWRAMMGRFLFGGSESQES